MATILMVGQMVEHLTERLKGLGFGVVLQTEEVKARDGYASLYHVAGKTIDVIIYRTCTCCVGQFKGFEAFVDCPTGATGRAIPVVIVRGGDYQGGNHRILGSVREDASDAVLSTAIADALKLRWEPE